MSVNDKRDIVTSDAVVVGGGLLGLAVAYYLSKLGTGKVVLVERRLLAEQNTSRAAGLLTQARTKACTVPLVQETYRVVAELESLLGESLGLRRVGSLYIAVSPESKRELALTAVVSRTYSICCDRISVRLARELAPWLAVNDADADCLYVPTDAFIDPCILAQAFARAARRAGVEILQQEAVLHIETTSGRTLGVITNNRRISSPIVIDAAGVWSAILAAEIGVALPMAPVRSHYWITEPYETFPAHSPIVILPDARAYARPEVGSLLFGLRERESVSLDPRGLPGSMGELVINKEPMGWGYLEEGGDALRRFFPSIDGIGIAHYVEGLSSYTPDGLFTLGAMPGLEGFFAATGCSGAGIAACGGIGEMVAQLALGMRPTNNPAPFRIDRFGKIDPFDKAFRERCAQCRSGKTSG